MGQKKKKKKNAVDEWLLSESTWVASRGETAHSFLLVDY